MAPIVQVEHVFKKYSRNANAHLSYGLGDLYNHLLGRKPSLDLRKDEFFAVNDVSFELEQGDTLALIGRNGSGKSTLLKMMNGLIKLDAGRIVMDGRVQALINLGTGFNASLSGMDNIYNSAALYGFNRKQTKAIADEVVEFAELEEFIYSPFETYSSGMKARLGFAVSVHLKPDILLIDEVLSVGDYAFRNKCYHRMQDLKKQGITILFVSHAKQDVLQICEKALWLHNGCMKMLSTSDAAMHAYIRFMDDLEAEKAAKANKVISAADPSPTVPAPKATKTKEVPSTLYGPIYDIKEHVENLAVSFTCEDAEADSFPIHSGVSLKFGFTLRHHVHELAVNFPVYREDGLHMSTISSLNGNLLKHIHEGQVECEIHIPDFDLNPGKYAVVMCIHDGKSYLYRNIVRYVVIKGGEKHTWGVKDFQYEYRVCAPSGK